ncbi:MAG: RNA-binding domain-containing protein [Acidilobaceae archaeon]
MARVVVEVEVKPTEEEGKVRRAVETFMEPVKVEREERGGKAFLVARSDLRGLARLHYLLRAERILDAARSAMKRGLSEGAITVYLHKQAAFAGKVSFVSGDHESPLGAIKLTIETDEPQAVIDCLAPSTSRGRPLWDRRIEECEG